MRSPNCRTNGANGVSGERTRIRESSDNASAEC
jgi:hypothetical protein